MSDVRIPDGYIKTNAHLTEVEAARIRHQWEEGRAAGRVMILSSGAEFVPFARPPIIDAICLYCASPNLSSSLWCEKCGAPLTREVRL